MDPAMAIEVAAMSRSRAVEEATARGDSDIQQFYRNSTVFLTGGSGFMGKQMIEKLFRSCQLTKIFILLRPKKGKQIQERLDEMFQDPVDVIYHMAATTRFDEVLRLATLINVRGTREAISLGKACKKLKYTIPDPFCRSFVHVSTAYTHAMSSLIKKEVYERFYESPIPPETLISMAEAMDVDRLNGITE
ncbi:Uncharacterized protein OBRU01_20787, partial [Operophtera brumata]